jgi:hypothetical protein
MRYEDARRLPRCIATRSEAQALQRCFSTATNQTPPFTTSPSNLRCSRPTDTESGIEYYSGSMFTTRSVYGHVSLNALTRLWNAYRNAVVKGSLVLSLITRPLP